MATALVLALSLQQLVVAPWPCEVDTPAVVHLAVDGQPVSGVAVVAEWADGTTLALGATDAAGAVQVVAKHPGLHRLSATHDGVRLVTPFRVVPAPLRWLWALVCVPLGLALLVQQLRRRGGAADQVSTRST